MVGQSSVLRNLKCVHYVIIDMKKAYEYPARVPSILVYSGVMMLHSGLMVLMVLYPGIMVLYPGVMVLYPGVMV